MSVFDQRPELGFEVVVTHISGDGVTVIAKVVDEPLARDMKTAAERVYGKGFVKVREVAS